MGLLLKECGKEKKEFSKREPNWACSRVDWLQERAEVREDRDGTIFVFSYRWEEGLTALAQQGMTFIPNTGRLTAPEVTRRDCGGRGVRRCWPWAPSW